MTIRRIAIAALGVILPFVLVALGSYYVETHTREARLAMYVMLHSEQMNDQQLAQAVGENPLAVIRRAALMTQAVTPIVALIVGVLVGFFERKMPGRLTALALMPYFLWEFSKRVSSVALTPAQIALRGGKVLGISAVWVALAVLAALVIVRLLARGRPAQSQVPA
jgi:hypothetical protein